MIIEFSGHIGMCMNEGAYYEATLLEFKIPKDEEGNALLVPSDLYDITLPELEHGMGLVISGRGPIWLYAYLVEQCHYMDWVATFDPRLGGAVVVSTHGVRTPPIGGIVTLPKLAPAQEAAPAHGPSPDKGQR